MDQENPENSPKRKKSRISKPLQPLSLPTRQLNQQNRQIKQSKSQSMVIEDSTDDIFSNSDAGVIKKLELRNFMCHGNFEIEFNPRINFISGVNGSGKSAIQTAIAIGLGGTASKTNRGSKIESLIKHGCNTGSIAVTLANVGPNAFKPTEYGREIRIVRNITSSSSTYRIFNQSGKLISNKKQELDAIAAKFRIQPNNPVSILNQDMARNFLSTNKAENKYAMFKKATLLDTAEISLNNISGIIADQKEEFEVKERASKQNDSDMREMAEKFELVERLKEAKDQYFQVSAEFAWGEAYALRDEVEKLENCKAEQQDIKDDRIREKEEIDRQVAEKEKQIEELTRRITQLQTETRTKEENVQKIRLEYRKKKTQYEEKCEEYQRVSKTMKNKKADKQSIQTSLDDIERDEAEQQSKREEARQLIEQLSEQVKESAEKVKRVEQEITMLRNTTNQFREMRKEQERTIRHLNEGIRANEREMASLKNSDDLSMYAQWMPTLVRRIDEAVKQKRFSKPPRGPLGRYVKVKHEKWTDAIENNLGGAYLSSFFVDNKDDRNELYRIMDQVIQGRKPTVHCSQFQEKHRDFISNLEAYHQPYFNMFRALEISDTVVANFLIDAREIHKILLVDDNAVCRQLAQSQDWVKNCRAVINLKADSYEAGYKFYSNPNPTHSRLLQKNMAHRLRSLQEEIAEQKASIAREEHELEKLNDQFRSASKRLDDMNIIHQRCSQDKTRLEREISEKRTILNMEIPSLQSKIDELNSIEEEIVKLEEKKKKIQQEQEEFSVEMRKAKDLLDQAGGVDTIVQQSHLSNQSEKLKEEVGVLKRRIANYEKKIEEQDLKIRNLDGRIQQARDKVEEKIREASQVSQEPASQERRSVRELKNEINELKHFIEEAEKTLGAEPVDFQKRYLDKKKQQDEFKLKLSKLRKMHEFFQNMWRERKKLTEHLRDTLSNIIFTQFQRVLGSRNYRGQLQFDHNKGRLDILMAPPGSGDNFMNTESLSGGEKSVSTVAFLMALWSNMDLPFYSMDEYDVFMDAINRRTITGLLTSFASEKTARQFIFLTPLDVSLIQTGPTVAVHRVNKIM